MTLLHGTAAWDIQTTPPSRGQCKISELIRSSSSPVTESIRWIRGHFRSCTGSIKTICCYYYCVNIESVVSILVVYTKVFDTAAAARVGLAVLERMLVEEGRLGQSEASDVSPGDGEEFYQILHGLQELMLGRREAMEMEEKRGEGNDVHRRDQEGAGNRVTREDVQKVGLNASLTLCSGFCGRVDLVVGG